MTSHFPLALCAIALSALNVAAAEPPIVPSGRFTDVTDSCRVAALVARHYEAVPKWWLSGITLVDLDGDGALDLHLASHGPGPGMAAANDGKGHFTVIDPRLATPRGPKERADLPYPSGEVRLPFDVDEDGRLDLLCSRHDNGGALYLNATPRPRPGERSAWNFRRPEGRDAIDSFSRATAMADLDGDGLVDYLRDERSNLAVYRGLGGGRFADTPILIPGLKESAAIPVDLDGDGRPDLLVSQRGYNPTRRLILHNESRGRELRFADVTQAAGLDTDAGSIHGVGDLDGDGSPDLVCVEGRQIVLYLNDGRGRFTRKANAVRGLEDVRNKPASTNWGGAVVVDLDNDGVPDVLVNGRHFFYVLRGLGGGEFAFANEAWGVPTEDGSAVDEGLCFGDIDNDGRLDLVTCGPGPSKEMGQERGVRVFHNDLPAGPGRHWLRVRPVGKTGNRAAAGAMIRLYEPGTDKLISAEQVAVWGRQCFHSYYAAAQTERHFGLGPREAVDLSVTFYPSGRKVVRQGVKADRAVEVREEE